MQEYAIAGEVSSNVSIDSDERQTNDSKIGKLGEHGAPTYSFHACVSAVLLTGRPVEQPAVSDIFIQVVISQDVGRCRGRALDDEVRKIEIRRRGEVFCKNRWDSPGLIGNFCSHNGSSRQSRCYKKNLNQLKRKVPLLCFDLGC